MSNQPRLIRKYVNRRLYDTAESRYVNLEDLRQTINAGASVKVVDQASNQDITTVVLLQIIAEAEKTGAPLLSASFLSSLIRLLDQDNPDPGLAGRLESALQGVVSTSTPQQPEAGISADSQGEMPPRRYAVGGSYNF